jgi:RNA polymerase-binding transcription factor DksA
MKREDEMSETKKQTIKRCSLCGQPIAPARLEALPGVTTCIECAKKHPRKVDVSGIDLSQASPINRNGFAPKD